jgi:hypothetical protein
MEAVQCDYCGKFSPNPYGIPLDVYRRTLPSGWFAVTVVDGGAQMQDLSERGEFCSRDCISEHFGHERHAVA